MNFIIVIIYQLLHVPKQVYKINYPLVTLKHASLHDVTKNEKYFTTRIHVTRILKILLKLQSEVQKSSPRLRND